MSSLISVTGCISTGKSTISEEIAKLYNCKLVTEDFGNNPFLPDYYKDKAKYAFKMQKWFLDKRIMQLIDVKDESVVVQDQMMYAFGFIFPTMQYKSHVMSFKDYITIISELTRSMDYWFDNEIIVYLRIGVEDVAELIERIIKRSRKYETSIDASYLMQLVTQYEDWFSGCDSNKVVVVNALDTKEFVLKDVIDGLNSKLSL